MLSINFMQNKNTYLHKLFFLFGLSMVFGVVVIPFLSGTWPGWLALVLSPLGLIIYILTEAILTDLFQEKGAVIPFTVFVVGGVMGAMILEGLRSLLG